MRKVIPYWKTAAWFLVMLVVFLMPSDNLEKAPQIKGMSELVHLFSFAVFTLILLFERTRKTGKPHASPKDYFTAILLSLLFGLLIEILQKACGFGRMAEWKDVLFDLSGTFIAVLIFWFIGRTGKSSH